MWAFSSNKMILQFVIQHNKIIETNIEMKFNKDVHSETAKSEYCTRVVCCTKSFSTIYLLTYCSHFAWRRIVARRTGEIGETALITSAIFTRVLQECHFLSTRRTNNRDNRQRRRIIARDFVDRSGRQKWDDLYDFFYWYGFYRYVYRTPQNIKWGNTRNTREEKSKQHTRARRAIKTSGETSCCAQNVRRFLSITPMTCLCPNSR